MKMKARHALRASLAAAAAMVAAGSITLLSASASATT